MTTERPAPSPAPSPSQKKSRLPGIAALVSLLILILLLGLYLGSCLKKPSLSMETVKQSVLGVSSFNTSASKNPVANGDSVTFTTNTVADSSGIVSATVKFDLSGQGVIDNNIHGPGACVKVTDTTATCSNVNIEANQTATWTVPVTANSNCSQASPASLSFQAQLVAPVGTFTSSTGVNCVASLPTTPTPTTSQGNNNNSPTPTAASGTTGTSGTNGSNGTNGTSGTTGSNGTQTTGGTGQSGFTTSGGNTTPSNATSGNGQSGTHAVDVAGLVCSRIGGTNGIPLLLLAFLLWLLAVIAYILFHRKKQQNPQPAA